MDARFSIIVPVRDGAAYVAAALHSVVGASEGIEPGRVEIVVADDGSVDDTVAEVGRAAQGLPHRVTIVHSGGGGAGTARNLAIAASDGDTLVFCDHDDLLVRSAIANHDRVLQAQGGGVTFGGVIEFTGVPPSLTGDPAVAAQRGMRHGPLPGSMALRRAALDAIGGFHVGEPLAEWPITYDRLRRSGAPVGSTPELVLLRRIHDTNLSRGSTEYRAGYARAMKVLLDERRRAAASRAAIDGAGGGRGDDGA